MKKLYALLFLIMTSLSFGQTFYSENIGTATGTLSIAANTFQNSTPIVYSGTADTRSTLATGTYAGASQGRNVFITNTADLFFQIDGLNTSAYNSSNIQLSFGLNTNNVNNQVAVEFSTNGTNWTAITYTVTATNWSLVTIPGGQIPSSSTLSLRFRQPNPAVAQFRIDDIKLSNVSSSCTLALGTPTTSCINSTLGIDTYSVTIPFTGGGNANYVITPSSGTVGGDNPTTTAEGNITITGISENTGYSVTIVGGTCNLDTNGNSPECKPVNSLPYSEPFPYTVGGSLNAEQKWTAVNSGDNITINSGSLSYTGITSTGNSITFGGSGAESRTPFTNTTTGTVYASFIATVTDLSNITSTDLTVNTYFAVFTDNSGATTNGRVWIRKNGTQYQYGLGTTAAPTDWDTTLYNVNDIQYVVLGYDFTNNILTLTINPTIGGTASPTLAVVPATAYTSIAGLIFRQDGNTNTPTMIIDELRVDVTPNFTLGTSQNEITGLKMYPNPVSNGTLFIETAANAEKTVTVFDVLGKQVLKTISSENEINVSELNAGVYVVKISEEGKTATKKLVVR
jgi:hypothetical protein